MTHPAHEGISISLAEEGDLDALGILRGTPGSTKAYGLPEESVRLFVLVAAAGTGGLPQSKVPKDMKDTLRDILVPLELQGLLAWERDAKGRLAFLVLTWKGEEALAAARPRAQTHTSYTRRKTLQRIES